MRFRVCRFVASAVAVGVLGACGGATGLTEEETVPRTEAELQAIEADQRIRDAQLAVRAMRPEERDLAPLLSLLPEPLRGGTAEYYTVVSGWQDAYEVDGQIDVVRQDTRLVSADEVVVVTCERDWINMIFLDGEVSDFRGGYGAVGGVERTFRRSDDGSWSLIDQRQDYDVCKGVESPARR